MSSIPNRQGPSQDLKTARQYLSCLSSATRCCCRSLRFRGGAEVYLLFILSNVIFCNIIRHKTKSIHANIFNKCLNLSNFTKSNIQIEISATYLMLGIYILVSLYFGFLFLNSKI